MKRPVPLSLLAAAAVTLALVAAGPAPSAPTTPSARAAKLALSPSAWGKILVDGRGRTLYLFEKDTRGRSACGSPCATYWPPLLTGAQTTAGRGVKAALLGVTRRSDGSTQVTYAGHPLYSFVQDSRPGQVTGENSHAFGADWYVVSAAGKKVEKRIH
jgi:predicted lipoprotein with Yx(FWY)xxD motif